MKALHGLQAAAFLCFFFFPASTLLFAADVHFTGASGTAWSDPNNWTSGQLPGPSDTAVIDIDDGVINEVFLLDHSDESIQKLVGRERVTIDGGILRIEEELDWAGDRFWLQSGTLEVPRFNVASGQVRINGGLSGLQQIDIVGGSVSLRNGDLSQLSIINNPNNRPILLEGVSGKTVDISALPTVGEGSINIMDIRGGTLMWSNPAEVTGLSLVVDSRSEIDLTKLAIARDFDLGVWQKRVEFSSLGEVGGDNPSQFSAVGRAHLVFPELDTLSNSDTVTFRSQAAGIISLPKLQEISTPVQLHTIHAGSRIEMPALRQFTDGQISHFDGVIEFSGDVTRLDNVNADVRATIEAGTLELVDSFVQAMGTINANTINISGTVSPEWRGGDRTRSMTIGGDYEQRREATFDVNIEGPTPGDNSDLLIVGGVAKLDGQLSVRSFGFTPSVGDRVAILTADSIEGRFSRVRGGQINTLLGFLVDYGADNVSLRATLIGDVNLDDRFDSGDLVSVFRIGEYEDGVVQNSDWGAGDWNGDSEFDSGDLVAAFQGGRYEAEPNGVVAVPEPGMLLPGLLVLLALMRARTERCA